MTKNFVFIRLKEADRGRHRSARRKEVALRDGSSLNVPAPICQNNTHSRYRTFAQQNLKAPAPICQNNAARFTNRCAANAFAPFVGARYAYPLTPTIAFAASKGKKRFALLVPNDNSGLAIAKAAVYAAAENNATVSKIAFYKPGTTDFGDSVKALVDYDKRSARLARIRKSLKAQAGDPAAARALKRLERLQALGDVDFDAVLIPESGANLKSALAMFGYYDVYSPQVRFLGTSVWENTDLSRETMAYGSWYPALSRTHSAYFAKKYYDTFGEKPASIYSLAYDAVALSSAIAQKDNSNIDTLITSSDGYVGINGVFRIFPNGTNEHSLEVLEVGNGGNSVVSEAPKRFAGPAPLVENLHNNLVIDAYYRAPEIYGKNKQAVQMAIYGRVLDDINQPENAAYQNEADIVRKALKEHNVVVP